MNIEELAPELQEKVKACTSIDDLVALAKEEGVELTGEQLDAIAGGSEWYECGSFCFDTRSPFLC